MNHLIKDNIYLAALLEGIKQPKIKEIQQVALKKAGLPKAFQNRLFSLANHYATAGYKTLESYNYVASPFENLKSSKRPTYKYKFPFKPLDLSANFFPNESNQTTVIKLWEDFTNEVLQLDKLRQTNTKYYAETILALLHKYTVTIPNPVGSYPEISHYDYIKSYAGIAVSLYDFYLEREEIKRQNKKTTNESELFNFFTEITAQDQPLLIIRADISGIQGFIYDIVSKRAAKNLKGRSFYVQLLSDTILQFILKELELYEGNVMYGSGGNFFLIAPNIPRVRNGFDTYNANSLEYKITDALFSTHKTAIAVVMAYQKLSQKDIMVGNLKNSIKQLFKQKVDIKKKRKFSALIKDKFDDFFPDNGFEVGGEQIRDAITGEEIKTTPDKKKLEEIIYLLNDKDGAEEKATDKDITDTNNEDNDEGDKKYFIKELTAKQIALGKNLKDVRYWVITEKPLDLWKKNIGQEHFIEPCGLGIYNYLVTKKNIRKFSELLKGKRAKIYSINLSKDSKFTRTKFGVEHQFGFMFYGGNDTPVFQHEYRYDEKGKPKIKAVGANKDFTHLTLNFDDNGKEIGRFKRLGVLKMDVDGLGSIFEGGLPYEKLTFSLYSALSRNLDWFFKGYLNTLWKENDDFKHYTQIIYSGGDDLFIVGRWDVVIQFAEEIKKKFAKWACQSDSTPTKISLSGGVAIVTDKFPIIKAATFADGAEKAAKYHQLKLPKSHIENIISNKEYFRKLKEEEKETFLKTIVDAQTKLWQEDHLKETPCPEKENNSKNTQHKKLSFKQREILKEIEAIQFKKNAFTILGTPLHWSTEYETVKKLKDDFVEFIQPKGSGKVGIPKGILGRVANYYYMAKDYETRKKEERRYPDRAKINPRWVWLVIYDFSRFSQRIVKQNNKFVRKLEALQKSIKEDVHIYLENAADNDNIKKFLNNIQAGIFTNSYDGKKLHSNYYFLELLNVAARWAELELRTKES